MTPMSIGGLFVVFFYCFGVISMDEQGLAGSATADSSRCGIGKLPSGYEMIRNGQPIQDTKWFPWMVSLKKHGYHQCGAVILNDRYILTAGHCVERAGDLKVHLQTESPEQMSKPYDIEKFSVHPKYGYVVSESKKLKFAKYDIALLKLKEKIKFNAFVNPICLPDPNFNLPVGEHSVIMGWGAANAEERKEMKVLNYATLRNLDYQMCVEEVPEYEQLRNHMLCLGGTYQTACFGDSGGPMVNKIGDKFYVLGLTSSRSDAKCLVSGKVLYTKVTAFVDWIKKEMQKN